jgi:predicted O-linked N-acetylglucosamine transferase (SPINDLY family)
MMTRRLDSQFAKARAAENCGDFPAAAAIYNELVAQFPGNKRARDAVAAMKQRIADLSGPQVHEEFGAVCALFDSGRNDEALARGQALAAAHSGQPAVHNIVGAILLRLRRPVEAEAAFRQAIALEPQIAAGYNNLGNALRDQKRAQEAHDAYRTAIDLAQGFADGWSNLGTALQDLGRLDEAMAAYDTALILQPDLVDALNNRGSALHVLKRFAEAEAVYREVLGRRPEYGQVYVNLGESLLAQDRLDEALAAFRKAVDLTPDYAKGWHKLGAMLGRIGDVDAALVAYEQALRLDPEDVGLLNDLGFLLQSRGEPGRALTIYELALDLAPENVDVLNNRGNALRDMGWMERAEEAFLQALEIAPEAAQIWGNVGITRQALNRTEAAIEAYDRALEIDPLQAECRMQRLYQRAHLCDWRHFGELADELALIDRGRDLPSALPSLALLDDPAVQQRRSVGMASAWATVRPVPFDPPAGASSARRIRVGYFSGDVHDHAIMYLASGLFREHDRSRFEVFVYSTGNMREGAMREQLINTVEHFHDVLELGDRHLFELVRGHDLDIALDVSGYTRGSRTSAFARRFAPVQINYLGYPGTLGAPFMDYIVSDPVLVPPAERAHITENLLVMPHAYQPNDNQRPISPAPTTRAEHGLPDEAFVFCCFNQGHKITPREFDIWMRLLHAVPGSVLWLIGRNETMRSNLRREAEARGIAAHRLVFAEHRPLDQHLARHRLADLFLDTFAYNAHTTMSDALWAGLPAITRIGRQFAARVGASLLKATGMEELIATSDADYEGLALALARDPARLATIRRRLAERIPTAPLFDTLGYTRALERGYEAAVARHRQGLAPADLAIPDHA